MFAVETFSVDSVAVEHTSVEKKARFVFAVETFSVDVVVVDPKILE